MPERKPPESTKHDIEIFRALALRDEVAKLRQDIKKRDIACIVSGLLLFAVVVFGGVFVKVQVDNLTRDYGQGDIVARKIRADELLIGDPETGAIRLAIAEDQRPELRLMFKTQQRSIVLQFMDDKDSPGYGLPSIVIASDAEQTGAQIGFIGKKSPSLFLLDGNEGKLTLDSNDPSNPGPSILGHSHVDSDLSKSFSLFAHDAAGGSALQLSDETTGTTATLTTGENMFLFLTDGNNIISVTPKKLYMSDLENHALSLDPVSIFIHDAAIDNFFQATLGSIFLRTDGGRLLETVTTVSETPEENQPNSEALGHNITTKKLPKATGFDNTTIMFAQANAEIGVGKFIGFNWTDKVFTAYVLDEFYEKVEYKSTKYKSPKRNYGLVLRLARKLCEDLETVELRNGITGELKDSADESTNWLLRLSK